MTFKRIIASALSASLVLGAANIAVQPDIRIPSFSASAADIVDSGECGENVTWELDSEGTLTIKGTGEMDEWLAGIPDFTPWRDYKDTIKNAIISKGVTSIGHAAFRACENLESITIPDSVTNIGYQVFDYTPWLEAKQKENPLVVINGILVDGTTCSGDVIIPDTVREIGESAFYNCRNLSSVTIPDSVTNIEFYAFYLCKSLESLTIPDSVTNIGFDAFHSCSSLESVTISDSVTSIGGSAFYDTPWLEAKQKENSLVIVNNILIDGKTCSGDVVIPDTVKSIGDSAFSGCTSLESITISNSVTSIGRYAFSSCEKLESITIPDSVTSIGDSAFAYCSSLKSIAIPDSVTSIEDCMFQNCTSLKSITIPNSVTSIGFYVFEGTPWLEAKQKEEPLVIINGILVDGNTCSGDVLIPDTVTFILPHVFLYCENLESITILNPKCEISDSICEVTMVDLAGNILEEIVYNGVICGYAGSTAEAYANKYGYRFESLGDVPTEKTTYGDANLDGKVSVADAVAILQFIGNRDKYPLSDNGKIAADVDGVAGITGKDALVIQQVDAGLYKTTDLPLKL